MSPIQTIKRTRNLGRISVFAFFVFIVCLLPVGVFGQTPVDMLNASGNIAESMKDSSILKLSLQGAILMALVNGFLVYKVLSLNSKLAVGIDRLSRKPCLCNSEDIEEVMNLFREIRKK